ncbi:sulfotransferase [Phenylobacterium sp.]|uniref:sulfotransferase family protein n=1 Tax=Phenylobacterium sp. TaxID=1871053 RepID=UPI00301B7C28
MAQGVPSARVEAASPELGARLSKLLDHIRNAGLGDDGLAIAYRVVDDILAQRERIAQDRRDMPEIAREAISRPIFVTGLPRSGTTLLHVLIGADPANRTPRLWEVARPSPPPALGRDVEARQRKTDQDIAELLQRDPSLLQSHPYFDAGGASAAECEHLGVLDFHFVRRTMGYYSEAPGFLNVDLIDDDVAFFESHRRILQHLQWRAPRRRWVLKGTEHYIRLEALKTVYPDAHVVWIHRDPQKVIPSIIALHCNLAEGMSGRPVDRRAFGRELLDRYAGMIDRALASPFARHPDVFHLRYADFAADPVAAVRSVYKGFGLPFGDTAAAAVEGWMTDSANQGDRHGRFRYDLADFGLGRADLEARFSAYRAVFGIPFEGVPA